MDAAGIPLLLLPEQMGFRAGWFCFFAFLGVRGSLHLFRVSEGLPNSAARPCDLRRFPAAGQFRVVGPLSGTSLGYWILGATQNTTQKGCFSGTLPEAAYPILLFPLDSGRSL